MRSFWKRLRAGVAALTAACVCAVSCMSLQAGSVRAADTKAQAPKAVYKVDTKEKVVALTFDISWGHRTPEPVLETLKKCGVTKATFFLSGPWTMHHPEIAKKIKAMGYEIGSHGYLHKDYSNYPDSWIREQAMLADKAIQQVTGVKPKLFRTPNGDLNLRVIRCLTSMGYTVVQWNTDSLDWKNPGVDAIVNRVTKRVVPGDIVLMHASDSSKQIVEALPRIVENLRQQGYRFVTVSELLAGANVQSKVQ
ncbi:polysaccharide deacetylase family sporulation protein PdaB [Alicyclobacillus acidocaldarius]|uniref:Polysaccharide deacetylase family sporulation protein PdaB n=1 Tax=Alicyclobacillus acidocaldarius subsp. acidocaldarius (strain ATCC 27009 / DSM 446 / BCRC 14685 / JCM 5260 / KCTC 1825 / NBRC 15652 / NCIMB 11725 / NRRL B-14509 / 104-IA) TaxID=521098 RepID=C8WTT6_ALIAD|nr:polysaccharide deacetylase family sporulation protein PdaB [Alicyclobacillus acidocaldarius]ACV59678.1 polysaccharide deacetylase family sporulation protein PdaB [Alicyclobacillus acidocaldarius subsp. acidocaldarius DSM 446]